MKKYLFIGAALLLVAGTVACSKDRTCRCSVLHSEKVRVIKISSGTCEDIRVFTYHNELDTLKVDSLLCTDYEFDIDAIYN
ncbi:MAG: hypothetical protein ACSW8I_08260 [bacterium]